MFTREPDKSSWVLRNVIPALPYLIPVGILLALAIAIMLVVIGAYLFRWEWTGFLGKSLWDWMKLLIVPVILALGGFLFTQMERLNAARAQHLEAQRLELERTEAHEDRRRAQEELSLTREGQITDRFTRTINQLGAEDRAGKANIVVRVGAIYALERLSQESERDYWPIMEILASYVRQHAPSEQEDET